MGKAAPAVHDEGLRNEREQARVRLGIGLFMAGYYWAIGFSTHPLFLGFCVYCFGYLAWLPRARAHDPARLLVALVLDNFFTVGGLFVTGERGLFLYIFLIHISFGYGVRYGRTRLWQSVTAACTGVVMLFLLAPAWRGNIHALFAYLLGVPFIALYIDYFVTRLRRARAEAEERTRQLARLLGFVAHDIRTPLQSLLATVETARAATAEPATRQRLGRIEQTVALLARMAGSILADDAHGADRDGDDVVPLYGWLLGVLDLVRDDCATRGMRLVLRPNLDGPPVVGMDRVAAERVLLNLLSNALRHAPGGVLEVTVSCGPPGAPRLVVTVSNDLAADGAGHTTAAPEAGAGRHGLDAVRETLRQAGGRFAGGPTAAGTFEARLELPCAGPHGLAGHAPALPAVLVTPPGITVDALEEALAGLVRVVTLPSLAVADAAAALLREDAVALFVHAEALDRAPDPAAVLARLGPAVIVTAGSGEEVRDRAAPPVQVLPDLPMNAPAACWQNALFALAALRGAGRATASPPPSLDGLQVLCVDDNLAHGEFARLALLPATVTVAGSVELARVRLASARFDVVLLDWLLDDEPASALVTACADASARHGTTVVVLSGEPASRLAPRLPAGFAHAVLERPLAIEALRRAVAAAAGRADGPTGLPVLEPWSLFDGELHGELLRHGATATRIDDLLAGFLAELERELERLATAPDAATVTRRLHGVRSIADAAGAYELGRIAGALDGSQGAAACHGMLAPLAALTRRHVALYRLGLVSGR